jgi:hypothetical protein
VKLEPNPVECNDWIRRCPESLRQFELISMVIYLREPEMDFGSILEE